MNEIKEPLRIAALFETDGNAVGFEKIEFGHINSTYKIITDGETDYILQKINKRVFPDIDSLMGNIYAVTSFLSERIANRGGDVKRETMNLVKVKTGGYVYCEDGEYYRMYIFVSDAVCYNSAVKDGLFGASAKAFGNFFYELADFDASVLRETIPNFHNTKKRLADFKVAVESNISGRKSLCEPEILGFLAWEPFICETCDKFASLLPLRVTHNDTKLNNVMFDCKTDEGICVIDLDTVMPGYAAFDFGDSIRFGGCACAEDDKDPSNAVLDTALYNEYESNFIKATKGSLTENEQKSLADGAMLMTVECGMRFLADFLNGDTYFSTKYGEHNLVRCRTQLHLANDMKNKLAEKPHL